MRNALKKLALVGMGLILVSQAKAQKIEIGQDAEQIKELIEWTTKDHNKSDSYGNKASSYWSWDVKYNNGKIVDVVQCYQKQYLLDFGVIADYCKHYIMGNGKLSYVLTQFENISVEKLIKKYNDNSSNSKIDEFYFSDNYEHYSKIYLTNNGLATIEWRRTIISELPNNIQKNVSQKRETLRSETKNQQEEELNSKVTKELEDNKEKESTILSCENFNEGIALVSIDAEHKAGEINYGYGKKLYGYINQKGDFIINPKYEKAFSFSNGFALVNTSTRYSSNWEFINEKGENIFTKKFSDANSFSEGLAAVRMENGSYGFIDKTGNFISKPQYESVGDFKEGFARVKFQDKWGFIDKTGKEIILPQFTDARDFSDGLALVSQFINYHVTAYSYLDKSSNIAIKLAEGDAPTYEIENSYGRNSDAKMEIPLCDFNNGLAMIRKKGEGNVFIDNTGKAVIKPKNANWNCHRFIFYQYINDYSIAELCGQFGLLDKKAKWAIKPMFDDVGNFHDGLAKVKLNGNWGFVDAAGNVVINKDILKSKAEIQTNPPYDAVSDFSDGLAMVKTRQKFGYIDKLGNWIIKPELTAATTFKNGVARVKFADRKGWNYIDKNGKILFPNFL